MDAHELPADEYHGPAVIHASPVVEVRAPASLETPRADAGIDVEVSLRGRFEPLDGRFHWYGRVAANERLAEEVRSGSTVTVTTPAGSAAARLSDVDPWGRFRISGAGRPPF